jgi:hypothetical protein
MAVRLFCNGQVGTLSGCRDSSIGSPIKSAGRRVKVIYGLVKKVPRYAFKELVGSVAMKIRTPYFRSIYMTFPNGY